MSSGSSSIFSKFFISSDPGVLKWLLILGGISFLGLGLTLNTFYPGFICPKEFYFPLAMAAIWLGGLESIIKHLKTYLFEYAFWVYVGMYLFIIFIAYSNNLHIGFALGLITAHIFFSVSFRSMSEYTIFAIGSLVFFSVCTFFRPNLLISPLLFLSIICAISLLCGVYVWMREHQFQDLMGGGEMLVGMLDSSEYAIFLLDISRDELMYTNLMAKQMLLSLGGNSNIELHELLQFLGLDKEYLKKRYKKTPSNELDLSYYSVNSNPGKPMELELRIGKMNVENESPIIIKAKDISFNKLQAKSLENSVALNDSLMLAFPDTLLVIGAAGEIKSVKNKLSTQLPLDNFIGGSF